MRDHPIMSLQSPFIPARPADLTAESDIDAVMASRPRVVPAPPVSAPRRPSPPVALSMSGPPRPTLVFARTELGDVNAERGCPQFDPYTARLLLLLDTPLTTQEIGDIINEPWIPAALIELERHRLIRRLPSLHGPANAPRLPVARLTRVERDWPEVRDQVRHHFEILLGSLGASMAWRITRCTTPNELDDLMPQLEALVEAVAGHDALDEFLHATGLKPS